MIKVPNQLFVKEHQTILAINAEAETIFELCSGHINYDNDRVCVFDDHHNLICFAYNVRALVVLDHKKRKAVKEVMLDGVQGLS